MASTYEFVNKCRLIEIESVQEAVSVGIAQCLE